MEEIFVFRNHTQAVYSVCFAPDGKSFVSGGGDYTVKVWSVEQGELVADIKDQD